MTIDKSGTFGGATEAADISEPRLDLWISDGKLYSIGADITLDVYVYTLDQDDADVIGEVSRFRSGGEFDERGITEARAKVDRGDLSR